MRKKIGVIGVDTGICWIGDPSYIHGDSGRKPMPKEFGDTWNEFCDNLNLKDNGKYLTSAQFNYDMGYPGLGLCVSTGYGDGRYNVYAEIINDKEFGKRVKSVTVVFIEDEEKSKYKMKRVIKKSIVKKKVECDHFWEIDLSDGKPISEENQKHVCMKCGKVMKRSIPIMDLNDFPKDTGKSC